MIKEKIDKFYLDREKERDRHHFYITEAGRCPRAVYFNFKKVPKKAKEARVLRVFDHGDYTHMRIMSVLFSIGAVKAVEVSLQTELIHGRADGIVTIDNEPYVIELKSINSVGFRKLEKPKKEHIKQLQLYLHYFKIPKGIFIYENKDTQELKEFIIEYDQKLAESIISDFATLKHFISNDIVPPIPFGLEDWECAYCDYAEECERIREAELKKQEEKAEE